MPVKLTQTDITDLKKAGYTEDEIQRALLEIEQEELAETARPMQTRRNFGQISSFSTKTDDNIVRWQLELNDILERAEHILKGDIPEFENNQIIWNKNPHPENNPLSMHGVQEVMKILAMYVNRNTILSDYSNDEINIKVYDAGREINNLLFMRYEDLGMDTEEKKKSYPIIVREIIDIIHSAYKRALDGAEKISLRQMIQVSQATQTTLGNQPMNNGGGMQRERGILNPMRYVRGKYV